MFDSNKCKHGKVFVCTRLRMLNYLRKLGFIPFETVAEIDNPKYLNWLFENSPELEIAINNYFNTQKDRWIK